MLWPKIEKSILFFVFTLKFSISVSFFKYSFIFFLHKQKLTNHYQFEIDLFSLNNAKRLVAFINIKIMEKISNPGNTFPIFPFI